MGNLPGLSREGSVRYYHSVSSFSNYRKGAGNETQQSAEFMDCIVLLSLLERQTCLGEIRSFPDQVNQSYLKTENQIQQKHT